VSKFLKGGAIDVAWVVMKGDHKL